jgi:chromate transporter
VLAVAQRELVERLQWLSKDQFAELLSLSQVLPGPNIVNLSLVVGDRYFGWRGSACAVLGLLGIPLVIVLTLAVGYQQVASQDWARGAMRGMGAVAAGLIIAMGLKLLPTLARNPMGRWWALGFFAGSLLAAAVLRWPLAFIVLGVGGAAWLAAWVVMGRKENTQEQPEGSDREP